MIGRDEETTGLSGSAGAGGQNEELEKRKRGSPPGARKRFSGIKLKDVKRFAKLGLSLQQIAGCLDIEIEDLYAFKRDHVAFAEALKIGGKERDDAVVTAHFQRAIGWEHEEDKIFCSEGTPVVVPTIRRYPGDVTAQMNWLKNRRPEEWRERQEIEITGHMSALAKVTAEIIAEFVPEEKRDQVTQKLRLVLNV